MLVGKGSLTFRQYDLGGKRTRFEPEYICERLSTFAFAGLASGEEGIAQGWVAPAHLFDGDFDKHRLFHGPYVTFALRIDTRKVPASLINAHAALEIQAFMNQMKAIKESQGFAYWELRVGIHSGPLVAGVIGEKKFAYDVWGETVNTASRMESAGVTGQVNLSATTAGMVSDFFLCESRGPVHAKNMGEMEMFLLRSLRPELEDPRRPGVPGPAFHRLYEDLERKTG